jgi:uncharacterized protein (DUF58 family)
VSRLGGALLLGVAVTAAAVAFSSRPLGVVGVGLLVAAGTSRLWARSVGTATAVRQVATPSPAVEGSRVRLVVEATRRSRMPVASSVLKGSWAGSAPIRCRLRGRGRTFAGSIDLGRVPRGRFPFSDARLVLGDHPGSRP